MSKIKVLHVHTLPVISGSGINTFLTMKGLSKDFYEVELACQPNGPLADEVEKAGIVFRPIKHFVQPVSPLNDFLALCELVRLMRRQRYCLVHTHNSKAGFIGRLAAKISGIPVIIHTIHGFSFHSQEPFYRRWLFCNLERFAARFADRLITISQPLTKWGLEVGIGRHEQYTTIYSGIELDKFAVSLDIAAKKKELAIPADHAVVGVVSKLWKGKGHEQILRAAVDVVKAIPQTSFVFVGEGYLRPKLEAIVARLALEKHVIFTGFRNDIPEITATFDVVVLASFFEGLGRVLLEAMALGKAVVATRVGGIVDVVDDGITGLLVEAGSVEALAQALKKLLLDGELRRKMGQAGRAKISEKFSAKTMVARIEEVYKQELAKKGYAFNL